MNIRKLSPWSLLAFCFFAGFFAVALHPARALEPGDPGAFRNVVAVVSVSSDMEAAIFAEQLAAALSRELAASGFRVEAWAGSTVGKISDAALSREISTAAQVRWTALARCVIDGQRLVWRVSVYDALDGALIAADALGAYPGLSSLLLLEQSAAIVAREAWLQRERSILGDALEYRLRFSSPDEGALVTFGTGEGSREAGRIEGGTLLAPFTAFRAGEPVVVSVAREGYWPNVAVFHPGVTDEEIPLKPLMPRRRELVSLGLSTSGLFGVTAEYRRFLSDDALFLRAADSLWLQYSFRPGSIPVLHNELRLGAGAYLFLPRDSRFRIAVITGFSGILTLALPRDFRERLYLDAAFDALSLSFEWHTPGAWSFYLEQRFAYSLGLDSGLLPRGWLEAGNWPMILSAGVMKRW